MALEKFNLLIWICSTSHRSFIQRPLNKSRVFAVDVCSIDVLPLVSFCWSASGDMQDVDIILRCSCAFELLHVKTVQIRHIRSMVMTFQRAIAIDNPIYPDSNRQHVSSNFADPTWKCMHGYDADAAYGYVLQCSFIFMCMAGIQRIYGKRWRWQSDGLNIVYVQNYMHTVLSTFCRLS